MSQKEILADIGLLLAALGWGFNFVVTKDALDSISPFTYASMRFLLATILMAIIFHKRLKRVNLEDLKAGIILGLLLFTSFMTQTVGLVYTTPGKSGFISGIYVIIVPFAYAFIAKESPGFWSVISAVLAVIGLALLSLTESFSVNIGDVLTIICAFLFAGHIIAIGIFAPKSDPVALNIIQFAIVAILSILSMFIWDKAAFSTLDSLSIDVWKAILYGVIVCTVGAYSLQMAAQKYASSSRAALILCLESVFAVFFSYLLWGEELTFRMILGCILIFAGIILTEVRPSLRRAEIKEYN